MAEINNPRRYCLLKARYHDLTAELGLRDGFYGKQESIAGTPLPLTVPHQDKLTAAHYKAVEDLTGADVAELVAQGLTNGEATAVLKSLA